ncbi:MAG: carbohydrate-binding domain-containing protein, partial [Clostridia bacterium]|nr:carbohydrate-binding domain-containing protein [Clostridia bacterium]
MKKFVSSFFVAMVLILIASLGVTETVGDFTITGVASSYSFSDGVLTVKDGADLTIANINPSVPTNQRIVIESGANVKLTLGGVNIETSSGPALEIAENSTGDVTITLAGGSVNTLISGNSDSAGLQKNGSGVNIGKLEITGPGSLTAEGGANGAGIGGGSGGSGSNITIIGGTVTAKSTNGAGIGGGYNGAESSNIQITGGTVTATSANGAGVGSGYNGAESSGIKITGGSVYANNTTAENDASEPVSVYMTTLTLKNDPDGNGIPYLSISALNTQCENALYNYDISDVKTDSEGNIYVWLPENAVTYTAMVDGGTVYGVDGGLTTTINADVNKCDLVSGSDMGFVINGGTPGTDYNWNSEKRVLSIITGSEMTIKNKDDVTVIDQRIRIEQNVSANLTLDGVDITNSSGPALEIAEGSTGTVTITLADGSDNKLVSIYTWSAGLQKNDSVAGIGTLIIQGGTEGTGSLTATGGRSGAGIGGYSGKSSSNITIKGGTVTAKSTNGAGIGGGENWAGSSIYIIGGTVTATSTNGAGIGGGYYGKASNTDIQITGGTVTAKSTNGAGIGSGAGNDSEPSSGIKITGGMITATSTNGEGIGSGDFGKKSSDIKITGGSVYANNTTAENDASEPV